MSDCSLALGCTAADAPIACSCISVCVGSDLKWAVVTGSQLALLRTVGTCETPQWPPFTVAETVNATLVDLLRALAQLPPTSSPSAPAPPSQPTPSDDGGTTVIPLVVGASAGGVLALGLMCVCARWRRATASRRKTLSFSGKMQELRAQALADHTQQVQLSTAPPRSSKVPEL